MRNRIPSSRRARQGRCIRRPVEKPAATPRAVWPGAQSPPMEPGIEVPKLLMRELFRWAGERAAVDMASAAPSNAAGGESSTMANRDEFSATTRDIRVSVRAFYLADQSEPDRGQYVWAYRVEIANTGRETVKLLRRTWKITDALGRTQTVHGAGVIGEQPVLEPGGRFEYTSGTPLATASGFMQGAYHMIVADSGEAFDVAIPAFSLDSPHQPSGRVH